jgi:hypothetical protein
MVYPESERFRTGGKPVGVRRRPTPRRPTPRRPAGRKPREEEDDLLKGVEEEPEEDPIEEDLHIQTG